MRLASIIVAEILLIILLVMFLDSETPINYLSKGVTVGIRLLGRFFIFVMAGDLLRRFFIWAYSRKHKQSHRVKNNFQFGINNIAKFIFGLGIIITIFGFFGIDFKSLVTSLSIIAAAIAIISKEYINDFIVGLYFSFSKDIEINDYIQLENIKGKVIEIQMLKIKILNDDDDLIIIPNSKAYNTEIINYTKRDIRSLSIDFQIDINTIKSIEHLEEELIASLQNFSEYLEPNSFNLKIVEMKKDAIDLKFQYTLKHLDRELQKRIRKKTVRQIFNSISIKTI